MQEVLQRYTSGVYKHLRETPRLLLSTRAKRSSGARSSLLFLFLLIFFFGAFIATRLLDSTVFTTVAGNTPQTTTTAHMYPSEIPQKPRRTIQIPLNCTSGKLTRICPPNYYPAKLLLQDDRDRPPPAKCPEYFRWIHEDLRPWKESGITTDMVERAKKTANFRLVIVNGRAYVEKYEKAFQTRDVFTVWGILQLLRRYPGKIPDLDLMFDCVDWPIVKSADYSGPNAPAPPPLFRYCGDHATLDIVFPDWSFWGWEEINIKPWEGLLEELKEGNKKKTWMDREAYAFWKGNPIVAATRMDLLKCNVSDKQDWGARVYTQDWIKESEEGYKQSDLASQCMHRYKIYIEGSAWSVSQKYILACNSVTLLVKPHYYDFFTRSLMPVHHYWPIREDDKCRSIKFAVEWGNSHKKKAQDIGNAAADFIQEDLKMDYVYDYMFHLLSEYAKLIRYKPSKPEKAIEICSETFACRAVGLQKKFMMQSMVKGPADRSQCTMPPPYDPLVFGTLLKRKANSVRQVELWEKRYWENQSISN